MTLHKRAKTRAPSLREVRIRHVEAMMRAGRWDALATPRDLAEEWKLTTGEVAFLVREATGRIADITRPEIVQRQLSLSLERLMSKCEQEGNYKDAIQAGRVLAEVSGAMAPRQSIITTREADLPVETLQQRLHALLKQARRELGDKRTLPTGPERAERLGWRARKRELESERAALLVAPAEETSVTTNVVDVEGEVKAD